MKRSRTCPSADRAPAAAFTLVEMLVAMAVLAIMTGLLATMLTASSRIWAGGQASADNYSKGRVLLDLLAEDLRNGIYRKDLASFPAPETIFYTRRPGLLNGSTTLRDVSLVCYELGTDTTLRRKDSPIEWSTAADQISFGNPTTLPNRGAQTPRDTASGVVAFKLLFVDGTGALSPTYTAGMDLRGFAVAIAIIDAKTLAQMQPAQLTNLTSALNGKVTGTGSVKADWDGYLHTGIDWTMYPKSLATGLKIFERYVPLQ